MGIVQILIPSYTGITRISLFCVFWSSKTGIFHFFFFWTHPPLGDLHFFVLFVFVFIIFDPTSVSANYLLSQLELT